MMGPDTPLPLPPHWTSVDDYVDSLLAFTTSSTLLQTLCGGVHVLDFYTRSPDLYSSILPQSWRDWFQDRDIMDILDLLMREDLAQFDLTGDSAPKAWRDGPPPPQELLDYITQIRSHLLARDFPPPHSTASPQKPTLPRHIALGMKVKKVHEVDNFARYVDNLTSEIAAAGKAPITHLVDFGSGQNYLGRALAAPPYSQHIVAVESKQHNIEGAKNMDILAKLVPKPVVMRNKKEWRAKIGKGKQKKSKQSQEPTDEADTLEPPTANSQSSSVQCDDEGCTIVHTQPAKPSVQSQAPADAPETDILTEEQANETSPGEKASETPVQKTSTTNLQIYSEGHGSVQYVEHIIKDGDLGPVINQVLDPTRVQDTTTPASGAVEEPTDLAAVPKPPHVNAMVISLHSCGNLVHHGLRSLLLDPHISAVAMVGCCYNLMTERLGPPTYKLPTLRPNHPRLEATSTFDPHGFPMSEKLTTYPLPHAPLSPSEAAPTGLRLNITARMMAVQAPFNWGPSDSATFFTRHFYRALLQRIFLDRGVVSAPIEPHPSSPVSAAGHTSHVTWTPPNGRGPGLSSDGTATPLTIGTLRKFAYGDFTSYVRAAVGKLTAPNSFCEVDPAFIAGKMDGLTDADIAAYEEGFAARKKELSVMWSLMAFSAGVVEAVVVVDRWLWLREQEGVEQAWVEPVFEYKHSPRNLVVVGIKG
jgi:hypothetical protein